MKYEYSLQQVRGCVRHAFGLHLAINAGEMVERRKKARSKEHPLARKAKLRPKGPALERRRAARGARADDSDRPERERITLLLYRSLIERLRNAVYWTRGMTMAGLVAKSLETTIASMEAERGAAFPERESELKIGRPAK